MISENIMMKPFSINSFAKKLLIYFYSDIQYIASSKNKI